MTTGKPAGGRMATLPGEDDDEMGSTTGANDGRLTKVGSVGVAPVVAAATGIEQLVALLKAKETELQTLQKTHDEYVKSSCEYEKELEAEAERFEKKTHSLEQLLASLETAKTHLQTTLTQTQQELSGSKKREDAQSTQIQEMKCKIQRLEQTNDELETANRVALASIDELQHKVDTLTEENVFLIQEKEDTAATAAQVASAASEEETNATDSQNVSGATGSEPVNRTVLEKRRSVRYPEVVESCLHMTCSNGQCRRASHIHQLQNTHLPLPAVGEKSLAIGDKNKKTKRSFFEKLRIRFMRG